MISEESKRKRRLKPGAVHAALGILRTMNTLMDALLLGCCGMMLIYGCYAIYDNNRIHAEAAERTYEAAEPKKENSVSFDQLVLMNPEVSGWLNIYDTGISHPFAKAENNSKYASSAIDGTYTLSGSLFLDYRNQKDFSDFNSFIYGHHMEHDEMFGALDHFLDESYFREHRYGSLYADGKLQGLEVFAVLKGDAYDTGLYAPGMDHDHAEQYLEYVLSQSIYQRDISITAEDHIVFLSTCADGMSNARLLVAAKITDTVQNELYLEEERTDRLLTGRNKEVSWFWVLFIVIAAGIIIFFKKYCNKAKS